MLLDKVREVEIARERGRAADWRALVAAVFADEELDPTDVAARLSQLDRTADELERAVAGKQQRAEWAKLGEARDRAAEQVRHLERSSEELEAEREAAAASFSNRWDELQGKLNQLRGIVSNGDAARRKLSENADPELAAQIIELMGERAHLQGQATMLKNQLKHIARETRLAEDRAAEAANAAQNAQQGFRHDSAREYSRVAEENRKSVAELKDRSHSIRARLDELGASEAEVSQQIATLEATKLLV
jgi:hypothetical protein